MPHRQPNAEQAWNRFAQTGRPADYLAFRQAVSRSGPAQPQGKS